MQAHRDYWHKDRKAEKVPDLEVYIVNVWPSLEITIPTDHDGVIDRKNDISHCDQTEYDQKVAFFVSDYYNLANELLDLAKRKGASKEEIDEILLLPAKSIKRTGIRRKFKDLLESRFELLRVVTIEHKDDPNSISNKWADYTEETINKLFSEGEEFDTKATVRIAPPGEKIIDL